MNSSPASIKATFTQNWLQSLTQVSHEPVARQIKPLLDSVSDLCRMNTDSDRLASAKRLWDFAASEGLQSLLSIIPLQQPDWHFDGDDTFVFHRTSNVATDDFDSWAKNIGVVDCEVSLLAEVTSKDWLSLVRQEAVRLQKSMNAAAAPAGMNLKIGCKAIWDQKGWAVRFDEADWVVVRYDDPFSVPRPSMSEMDECLGWLIANANETLVPKVVAGCTLDMGQQQWMNCVERFASLHQRVLVTDIKFFSPWFRKTWACVWTVLYREQSVLKGQADIDYVRREIAACITNVPRLTTWMFAFAKLLCECQLGRGLGTLGDFRN